ncbi:MAG: hypothetical protein WCW67_02920 [Candidatus Margulisiibacteriota bacterium]|jgi:hypothetical protein
MAFSDINFTSGVAESRASYVGKKPGSREDIRGNSNKLGSEIEDSGAAVSKQFKDSESGPVVLADPGTPETAAVPGQLQTTQEQKRPGVVV